LIDQHRYCYYRCLLSFKWVDHEQKCFLLFWIDPMLMLVTKDWNVCDSAVDDLVKMLGILVRTKLSIVDTKKWQIKLPHFWHATSKVNIIIGEWYKYIDSSMGFTVTIRQYSKSTHTITKIVTFVTFIGIEKKVGFFQTKSRLFIATIT